MSKTMSELGLFCVVDFEEGPQVIPSNWLTADRSAAFWPPWADTIDQVRYDKNIKRRPPPQNDWGSEKVKRLRASADDFEAVRRALTVAAENSETDLNDELQGKVVRKRHIRRPNRFISEESDDEEESTVPKRPNLNKSLRESTKAKLPDPAKLSSLLFGDDSSDEDGGGRPSPQNVQSAAPDNNESRSKSSNATPSPAQKRPEGGRSQQLPQAPDTVPNIYSSQAKLPDDPSKATCSKRFEDDRDIASDIATRRSDRPAGTIAVEDMSDLEFKRIVVSNFKSQRILLRDIMTELKGGKKTSVETSQVPHADDEQNPALLGLPAVDRKEMKAFDKKLKDKVFEQQVISALKGLSGGVSLGDTVRKLLREVMVDSLASLYSFQGGKGKERFDKLRIKDVLFRVAKSRHENAKDSEVQNHAAKWMANAPARVASAEAKRKKPASQAQEDAEEDETMNSSGSDDNDENQTDGNYNVRAG